MPGRDAIAGLVVTAASLFLFWLTLGLERNPLVPIGPAFYPRIVLGITALFGLALCVRGWLARRAPRQPGAPLNYPAVAIQFAAFALYVLALPPLGFRIATFAYVAAANLLLSPPRRPAHWLRAAALGAATAAATYYAFEVYLLVLLPRGSWTDF
ncbi:MAG TPA: tripartite tricarboxylate transporter TctB family protein [Burkholderiales bacterium]